MTRFRFILAVTGVLAAGGSLCADVIQFQADDFVVFAGRKLSTGKEVQITGRVGALDDIRLGQSTVVTGDVYSGDDFSCGSSVRISGRALASDALSLGQRVWVGRLDAGTSGGNRNISVDRYSTVGEIRGGKDVILARDVTVSGSIHAGDDLRADRDTAIAGNVYVRDDAAVGRGVRVGEIHVNGDSLSVGRSATTASLYGAKDVNVERDATVQGDIHAGDDVSLNRGVTVQGSVTYVDSFWQHSSATVAGGSAQGTPDAPQAQADPDAWQGAKRTQPGFSHGSADLSFDSHTTAGIAPGTYRDLWAGHDATLSLAAGQYEFRDVWLDAKTKILADTTGGDVVIRAADDFGLARDCQVQVVGDGQVWIYAADNLDIGSGGRVRANLLAFDDMSVDRNAGVEGILYAHGNLELGDCVTISAGGAPEAVPEPGTLALLGLGAVGVLFRRRRRHVRA